MGKKGSLKIDISFDPQTDEYHEGDYDDEEAGEGAGGNARTAVAGSADAIFPAASSRMDNVYDVHIQSTASRNENALLKCSAAPSSRPPASTQAVPLTVLTPKAAKKSAKIIHYVPNPKRLPLFTDHVASHDGLLVHVASYLHLKDILRLGMASKLLQEALSADALYCRSMEGGRGVLLPCLRKLSGSLLPLLDATRQRSRGTSQKFAVECMMFTNSCEHFGSGKGEDIFQPRTVMNVNASGEIAAMSIRRVRWEPANAAGKSQHRSSIRLSYVRTDANNSAVVSVWSEDSMDLQGIETAQQSTKERYLPPNTKTVLDAAIHLDLCALLATPVDCNPTDETSLSVGYVLSVVALPAVPPGRIQRQAAKHSLKWQRNLASNWQLFSASTTHSIVSFSGAYLIAGSAEMFGVFSQQSGGQLWSVGGATTSLPKALASSSPSSVVNGCLIHHEFLFCLDENGTRLRVYDLSNHSCRELAEGLLPWSIVLDQKRKQAAGPTRRHHTWDQHRQHLQNEYQMAFCAGRIFVTGMYAADLLCSSSPRLLRRLRSRLPSSNGAVLQLQFVRAKANLNLGTPHLLHPVNDTHLYIVDSAKLLQRESKVHCWRSSGTERGEVSTVFTTEGFIERIFVDATKMVVGTNTTFRNTTTRSWSGSGSIWVVPIDSCWASSKSIPKQHPEPEPEPPYPTLQLHHRRYFGTPLRSANPINTGNRNPRYPISNSTNSNHKILEMHCDGRNVLVYCNKGESTKCVVLDLYSHEE